MSGLDPRLRQRVQTVPVRSTVKLGTTNAELLEAWKRSAKVAPSTLKAYESAIGEALRFFTTPEGAERPVKGWTKADIWDWIHYTEANYCRHFLQIHIQPPVRAKCLVGMWEGVLPAGEAAQTHCAVGCPKFASLTRQTIRHKLHALTKWFRYLARGGAIAVNFMPDVLSEWYEENPKTDNGSQEKRRNPTDDEVRLMVNETVHPMRRALYACSFKWWARPNEVLSLDRYASLGLPMPPGRSLPPGFASGFPAHPEVRSFEQGGCLIYIPEKVDGSGEPRKEKRKGNRWLVVDAELRPILEQYLSWWERTVERDNNGVPVTTALWITELGTGIEADPLHGAPPHFNERTWYKDAELLGVMQPGDREDPRRKMSGHCARHYGQRKCQDDKVHSDWNKHFRGDAFKDARGDYFKPEPLVVQREYFAQVRPIGFKALPNAPALRAAMPPAALHKDVLLAEILRIASGHRKGKVPYWCARIVVEGGPEPIFVPMRLAPSVVFALRNGHPAAKVRVEKADEKQLVPIQGLRHLYETCVLMLERART